MITEHLALGKQIVQMCVCVSSPVRRPALDKFVDQVQMGSSSNKAFQTRTQFDISGFHAIMFITSS